MGARWTLAGLGLAVALSCGDPAVGPACPGESVVRCRTFCEYWCDSWGCYPTCWDRCYGECLPTPAPAVANPPAPADGGDASSGRDAATSGVLCSTCAGNEDCGEGALCIFSGGAAADAGATRGFCGHACAAAGECPAGFLCTQLGATRQCLPTSGTCP